MAEQDVLDKLNDVLDKISDNKEKLDEIKTEVDAISIVNTNIFKRSMSFVYTCTDCRGVGCPTCDNTGLLPRPS